jgi:starvation-inducible DNA-binding protein
VFDDGDSTMTMTALPIATAGRTTEILQALLVELIDLSIQGKQAHWTVTGPMFKPVHEHLDAIVDDLRTAYDDIAERMAALEVPPDGRVATVVGTSPVQAMAAGWQADAEVVVRMLERLEAVSGRLGGWIDELGELDLVSQDMLIGIRHGIDKHAWMLRVQTRGG